MIVRAVPGHVAEAERLVRASGGVVGRELSIISGFAAQVPADASEHPAAAEASITAVDADTPMQADERRPGARATTRRGDFGSMSNVTKLIGAQALWAAGYTGRGCRRRGARHRRRAGRRPVGQDRQRSRPVARLPGRARRVGRRLRARHAHGRHHRRPRRRDDARYADPTKFVGVAPDARIVNVKVGAADGSTDVSQVIAGIDWVVQHRNDNGLNIKVLNLSFGTLSSQAYTVDPLAYAAEVAWRHGVVVVAAAGNDGSAATQLADPAYDPRILAVGAYDPNNSYQADKLDAGRLHQRAARRRVSADVFAPGVHIVSLRDPGSYVDTNYPESQVGTRFTRGSGTSQAAAVTSGLVADLFEKLPERHARPDQERARADARRRSSRSSLGRSCSGSTRGTGHDQRRQGDDHEHHAATTTAARTSPTPTGTGSLEARPRWDAPHQRHVGADRRAGHLRQRVERRRRGSQPRRNGTSWNGGTVERAALERRRLGRAAVVERHLDRQRLVGQRWSGQRWSGLDLGRSALERSALERRRLGRASAGAASGGSASDWQ